MVLCVGFRSGSRSDRDKGIGFYRIPFVVTNKVPWGPDYFFSVVCGENERRSGFAAQFSRKQQEKPSGTQGTNKGEFEEKLTTERREKLINAINLARKNYPL